MSDIQGKLEKAARSLEKLYCRKYLGLGLILSLCDVEMLLFFLNCRVYIGMENAIAFCSSIPLRCFFFFSFKFRNSLFFVLQHSC